MWISLGMVTLLLLPSQGFGQVKPLYSYYNMFYGARSIGMANAFTALADDLTAVFRNPAGVAELDVPQIFIDYRYDKLQYNLERQSKDYTTYELLYDYSFNSTLKNMDFAAISAPVIFWDMKWCFALSYYRSVPYGINGLGESRLTTSNNSAPNEITSFNMAGSSGIDMLALTSAFYLSDYLSFGVTVQRYFNSGTMSVAQTFPSPPISTGLSYTREYTDKFKDTSLLMGLRFKLMEEIILGFSYQFGCADTFTSQDTYQLKDGTAPITSTSTATLTIPAQYAAGLVLKPLKFMDLAFDYSRQYWGKATLSNYYGSTIPLQFPVRNDFTFAQKDTINLRMGTQFIIPLKKATVFIRGGLFSDQQLFANWAGEKVKLKGYSLGVGLEIKPWIQLDAAYMRQKGVWKEAGYFDPSTSINSTAINKIFCVSLTFKFGTPPVVKEPIED